jgi:hypothetical protein
LRGDDSYEIAMWDNTAKAALQPKQEIYAWLERLTVTLDSITVHATLFNDHSWTEDIRVQSVGASFTGDLRKTFHFTFGPTGDSSQFSLQFLGIDLSPGASFPFVWGILTPVGGAAAPGVYPADPALLGLRLPDGLFTSMPPLDAFVARVVSEPPQLSLLLGAIAATLLAAALRGKSGIRESQC